MGLLGFLGGNKGGGTPKWAKQPMLDAFNKTKQVADMPFEGYTAQRVAGLSPTQQMGLQAAINAATSNVGGDAVNSAINLAKQAAAYSPMMITPASMAAASLAPVGDVNAAAINRADIANVTAGSFLGGNVSEYMNPYIQQVIDTTLTDLSRQREIQRQADNARAVQARAFGGSRQAVADAQTSEAFNSTMASTLAGLYGQGYDRATALMMQDYDRALQASQGNQSLDASVAGQNAGFAQQAALADQGNRYNQSYQNAVLQDQAGRANLDAQMQALQLNQAAGLGAANLGLNAATQLGNFGKSQQDMSLASAASLLQAGEMQRLVEQAKLDADYEEFVRRMNYPIQMANLMQGGGQMMAQAEAKPQTGLFDTVSQGVESFTGFKKLFPSWK